MMSLCMTILIAVFSISGVCMETCPEAEDIYPCSCEKDRFGELAVTCSSGTLNSLETLQQGLRSLRGKGYVDLTLKDFNISIPSNFFAGIRITRLEFHSCRIDSLANDGQPEFLGLENHLEVFRIVESTAVPFKLNLRHLKKLEQLWLLSNNITELGDDLLGPSSLQDLFIVKNNITKLGSNVFSQLNNLRILWLEEHQLGPVKRSMFPTPADKLNKLYLENNGLTDLPVDLFSRMPSIEVVSLSRNGITTLDEHTWSPIWQQLRMVELSGNNIVCDDRLNWIIKSKKRPWVSGKCSAPKELEGKDLKEFFETRSR